MRNKTPEEFYDKCYENGLRGFRCDRNITYGGARTTSSMECESCGWVLVRSTQRFRKGTAQCPICNGGQINTEDEWFQKHRHNYSDIFEVLDFSKFKFNGVSKKSIFICSVCDHEWNASLSNIDQGKRCPECGNNKKGLSHRTSLSNLIILFESLHHTINGSPKYGYHKLRSNLLTDYGEFYCFKCGKYFIQTLISHKRGGGCKRCADKMNGFNCRKSVEQFVIDAVSEHGGDYNYTMVNYTNAHIHIMIWCKMCQKFFWQTPHNHLHGCGCPSCRHKRAERRTSMWLTYNTFKYETQWTYTDLVGMSEYRRLSYDFYLPEHNTLIECDGGQHFKAVDWFGGDVGYKRQQEHDRRKTQYAIDNNIKLIRIRYDESVNDVLSRELLT